MPDSVFMHWLSGVPSSLWQGLAIGLIVGGLVGLLLGQRRLAHMREQFLTLDTRLQMELKHAEETRQNMESVRQQFSDTFAALSSEALQKNNSEFLRLAQENLKRHQSEAEARLTEKETAFASLVKPIKETLDKTDEQLRKLEKDRRETYGSISQYLDNMAKAQASLQTETRNLVQALRRPEVRGQWGELTLKRLVELAGLVEYCDFDQQVHTSDADGISRPDMIIRMPDQRDVVVDAKTPLDAYLSATEQVQEEARNLHLQRHAKQVRERVRELSRKAYWSQFKQAPDFVVLFIPGDQFLSAALEQDPQLLEDALRQKVILATPTSLIALLRAVAFGWRQLAVAENAEKIRELGEDFYKRLSVFIDHLDKMGASLGRSVEAYNRAVGSLERQVMPGARKFQEMGIEVKKPVAELEPIETSPRSVASSQRET